MTFMFLYPLLGGAAGFFLLRQFIFKARGCRYYRLSYNSYNSGIATLTVSSALKGVFDIAGTSSSYLTVYIVVGIIMAAFGIGVLLYSFYNDCKSTKNG